MPGLLRSGRRAKDRWTDAGQEGRAAYGELESRPRMVGAAFGTRKEGGGHPLRFGGAELSLWALLGAPSHRELGAGALMVQNPAPRAFSLLLDTKDRLVNGVQMAWHRSSGPTCPPQQAQELVYPSSLPRHRLTSITVQSFSLKEANIQNIKHNIYNCMVNSFISTLISSLF